MNDWVDKRFLVREFEDEGVKKTCEDFGSHLRKSVNLTTRVLGWCADAGSIKSHHLATLFLRRICEQLDGVSELVERRCDGACIPLLRASFEASLSLRYLLANDAEQRTLQYRFGHYRSIAEFLAAELQDLSAHIAAGTLKIDPARATETQTELTELHNSYQATVDAPLFAHIKTEWERTRKTNGRHIAWYSLFGGPRNLKQLAASVGAEEEYKTFYGEQSKTVHAVDLMDDLHIGTKTIAIRPIRHGGELQSITAHAGVLLLQACTFCIEKICPFRMVDWQGAMINTGVAAFQRSLIKGPLLVISDNFGD